MFVPLRSAFMVIAALTASSVAPAQVNPVVEPQHAAEWTPLPPVDVDQLLEQSTDPLAPIAEEEEQQAEEAIKPGATLAETVANLRGSEPGSRELECLAVGIYFEAKSESLAGQLAVGHVIANRAESGRFPSSSASSASCAAAPIRIFRAPAATGRMPSPSPRSSTRNFIRRQWARRSSSTQRAFRRGGG